jgi:toxin ParE1/3/4
MKRRLIWSRSALDELKSQITYVARDNPAVARRVAARIRAAGDALAEFATGHPGRVAETYEKSVSGLPYILAYAIDRSGTAEKIHILHVIHTARDWPEAAWPN